MNSKEMDLPDMEPEPELMSVAMLMSFMEGVCGYERVAGESAGVGAMFRRMEKLQELN